MSLEDSVDLVFHAFINGKQGEIYVQKSPASTLQNLAIAICELFNYQQKIKRIGTRHGEKLFESLISREEMVRTEDEETKYIRELKSVVVHSEFTFAFWRPPHPRRLRAYSSACASWALILFSTYRRRPRRQTTRPPPRRCRGYHFFSSP